MLNVLYEDKYIICCVKPIGILSQAGKGNQEENMISLLQQVVNEKNENPYIGLVHRLDRNVGGVMVFAKSRTVAAKLSEAIRNRELIKEYYAVVHNCPKEKSGIFKDLLFKDSSKNKTFVVNRMRKGVKEASLEYEVIETKRTLDGDQTLVKIILHTGRTHQIRVQFGSRKMPLVGDGKYGSRDNISTLSLWSYRISFSHPIKNKLVDIKYLPPNIYPWNEFKALK
jgi:23S rRNA pseudouridine1911/1915/1917 synthase